MKNVLLVLLAFTTSTAMFAQNRTIETWTVTNETSLFRFSTFDIGIAYRYKFLEGSLSAGRMHNHQIDATFNSSGEFTVGNYAKLGVLYRSFPKPDQKVYVSIFAGAEFTFAAQKAFSKAMVNNRVSMAEFNDVYTRSSFVASLPAGITVNIGDIGIDLGLRINTVLSDKYGIEGAANVESKSEDYFNALRIPTPGLSFLEQGKVEVQNPDITPAPIDVDLFLRIRYTFSAFGYFYY